MHKSIFSYHYEVKIGDTLYSIAKNNQLSVDILLDYNPQIKKKVRSLKLGDKISLIPKKKLKVYIIKKGDTLYSIAHSFKVSLENLKKWNTHIKASQLKIGQSIYIKYSKNVKDNLKIYQAKHSITEFNLKTQISNWKNLSPQLKNDLTVNQHLKLQNPLKKAFVMDHNFEDSNKLSKLDNLFKTGIYFKVKDKKYLNILASHHGNIIFQSEIPGYGMTIILEHHSKFYSIYSSIDLKPFHVKWDQKYIKKGEILGKLLNKYSQLYFQIWLNNGFKNPLTYFQKNL